MNLTTISQADCKTMGHVYVIESMDGSTVKIGRSINPDRRIKTIKNQANASGRVWISPLQADSHALERICHRHHSDSRLHGEWFSVSFDDAVKAIESFLAPAPSEEFIAVARRAKKGRYKDFLEDFQRIPTKDQAAMQSAFATAKLIRDVIVLHMETPELDYQPNENFGGISSFELIVAIYIHDADRECVASLFHEAVIASGSEKLRSDLFNVLSESALLDAKKAGIQPANSKESA